MSSHPLITRALSPGAPVSLRLATARGRVPVPRSVLLSALIHLLSDPDGVVRDAAQQSISKLTETEIFEILSERTTEGMVVDHLLASRRLERELLSLALTHPEVSDETLNEIARSDRTEVLDILVSNQERLMRSPNLLARLETNPALSRLQRSLLADFREQFFPQERPGEPLSSPTGPATAVSEPAGEIVTEKELASLLREVGDLPFLSMDLGDLIESDGLNVDDNDLLASDASLEGVWKRLQRMGGRQRLKEALRGGREERSILVRDRNRIIAAGVLKNPRLTDMEVESFASHRSLHEDILRIIGQSREWMRCYPIVLKLVRNPKTPAGIALNHLPRLQTRDLQNLVRDHNVPEAIRRMARRQSDAREKKVSFTRGKL